MSAGRRLHLWSAILGASLFLIATGVIIYLLEEHDLRDIAVSMRQIPTRSLLIAAGLTVLAYGALTLYDIMACRYVGARLHWAKVAGVACIGYAFNNNMGMSNVGGGSVRLRFYMRWGCSPLQIAQIIIFCGFSLWLGLGALTGLLLFFWPGSVPAILPIPTAMVRPLGLLMLVVVGTYALMCIVRRRPFNIRGQCFSLPTPRLMVAQFLLGMVDWVVCALVLYTLLPESAQGDFARFLALFLLAHMGGGISQVPGGLGVVESIMLLGLRDSAPASLLLGSLLTYRAIYYLLPLALAALAMGIHEMWVHRRHLRRAGNGLANWRNGGISK